MSVVRVVCAIVEKNGRVLVARRAPGQSLAGFWEFPGGKIEPGESDVAALVRELREELSIEVERTSYVGTSIGHSNGKTIELIAYRARWVRGEITRTVHDLHEWITVDRLRNFALAPADEDLRSAYLESLGSLSPDRDRR